MNNHIGSRFTVNLTSFVKAAKQKGLGRIPSPIKSLDQICCPSQLLSLNHDMAVGAGAFTEVIVIALGAGGGPRL